MIHSPSIANCGGYIVYISLIAFIQGLLVAVFDDAGHVSQHRTNSTRPIQQEHDLEVSYSCSTYMANIRKKKHDQKILNESRIGHFRVLLSLSFKASLSAKFLLW